MTQTVRLTITPDLKQALQILDTSTMGTLNTTELIKMAVGGFAQVKKIEQTKTPDITPQEMDAISARSFYEWAKEDGTVHVNNISPQAKITPFTPEPYVPNR